jgi:hypothetical protein
MAKLRNSLYYKELAGGQRTIQPERYAKWPKKMSKNYLKAIDKEINTIIYFSSKNL